MSSVMTPRHRWVVDKIAETFDIETDLADRFLSSTNNKAQIDEFFAGQGPSRLFVFFQPPDKRLESGEYAPGTGTPELSFTDGTSVPMRRKAMYIVRLTPQGKSIDTEKSSDATVIVGDISSDPLQVLEGTLANVYRPALESRKDWGKATAETKEEFIDEMERFVSNMQDALESLDSGIELRRVDAKYNMDLPLRSLTDMAEKDANMVRHLEDVLASWCKDIQAYLKEEDGAGSDAGGRGRDVGPMSILDYWRRRMQRLTSITEQLKRKECKAVITLLSTLSKAPNEPGRQSVFNQLRDWKAIDIGITEAANEAKDNVKYLFTLEKFIEPLYRGNPVTIIDTLPALLNSIKMIHTIARYFNTTDRMTDLFVKITMQMIQRCKDYILEVDAEETGNNLWKKDPQRLVSHLQACLRLNEAYQEQYRLTKEKLEVSPKGKQFDFSEHQIFGKFDLFCRRVIKLMDMFSTIHQFRSLASHKLEGMEDLLKLFERIITEFQAKRHDLLDFQKNNFDRDYVEFNVKISELETLLQQFINSSFESIKSIDHSLNLLKKFQSILQRESLKADLDDKFNIIFQTYGGELETVQSLYERHKHNPPIPRNLPPVAGNITWSRHLLKRIEEPMRKFESNQTVLASRDAKRIIKMYNKVARTLVAFEYLWYQAWVQSIETAKAGLQATLIIRHPEDGKLYVNFDQEILQLIREAKCLDRMGIEVPEGAKIVLLQESKFKSYYNDLSYALKEYERIRRRIIPVTASLLKPHINDMEYKLRPGMITLTWTSMNIDAYKHHVFSGLHRLEELVNNINDIIENRIEKNLKIVSKTLLVDLPEDKTFALDDFGTIQEDLVSRTAVTLQGKNIEIENSVEDLITIITSYQLDPHIAPVQQEEIDKMREHYNHFMYQALLNCAKNSLNAVKKRVGSRSSSDLMSQQRPFFEVNVQLADPSVSLSPDLDEVQAAINRCAKAVLSCPKHVYDWGQEGAAAEERVTFFDRITRDIEIVRVLLLLTGSIQGTRNQVTEYLADFSKYDWLWKKDANEEYKKFMKTNPRLEDYEAELLRFNEVEEEIAAIPSTHYIGALCLNTERIKAALTREAKEWKIKYSGNLHKQAQEDMQQLLEYIKTASTKLGRGVEDLDSLGFVMQELKHLREKESGIEMEITPILDMYAMLEHYLPDGYMNKEEMDQKSVLRGKWRSLVEKAELVTDEIATRQVGIKKKLFKDVKAFKVDVENFRHDYLANGPMLPGLKPMEAVERLKRYEDEFDVRDRKFQTYRMGEELFAIPLTEYPQLEETRKELSLLKKLYGLYMEVMSKMDDWAMYPWNQVPEHIDQMTSDMDAFATRCKKMPGKLRSWPAYVELKKRIEDFQTVLPMLVDLAKPCIKPRHWTELSEVTGKELNPEESDFTLNNLLNANLVEHKDDVEEIADAADKQEGIEKKLDEIATRWDAEVFNFTKWKERDVNILLGVGVIVEELEEAQLNLQTMLTMRHVAPFRDECQHKLKQLSETSEQLELWLKVQMLWCSLESVFLTGDIAKQMPAVAKRFSKIDKDFVKIMAQATDTERIVEACSNELLKTSLPRMYEELEECQKKLENYLDQKRSKFPRFYFVSNPVLLQILSQGSDPTSIQGDYEKIFDAISSVVHDRKDKTVIRTFYNQLGEAKEVIDFLKPVKAVGNIEEWLMVLLKEMQKSMKELCAECAMDIMASSNDIGNLRSFVDKSCGQYALLGLQFMWTSDVQFALENCKQAGKKNVMRDANAKSGSVLSTLSSWCLQDLGSKMNRRKIETLVTIQVHQRDVMDDLFRLYKNKKLSSADDFEWLKQARFYWRPEERDEVSEDGACVIEVTDVPFNYQYEYLGCKERLVITPLTDRCYITLAQALGMHYGGAPAGPAGTGKTETVKDMGRTLGIYVVVTNCSDQMRYNDCAKIFKGLCMGGLWGCFDEFNRILLPVLSVVAQQVLAILNAKKNNMEVFNFPGDPQNILLNPVCGFFITMNPGYAGRQELPENLKALFRGVAMMVPDKQIIIKVKLCSVGYQDFGPLSKKFYICYKLCEEQLSKQKHYDFGLRNILSVLRNAGSTKRKNLETDEELLLYRTLRDMNLSKLVAQDVPLFLSLLKDLFPKFEAPPKSEYPGLNSAIQASIDRHSLIHHESWVLKVVQLYETYLVRHGIMLTGPTGGGKSTIQKVLTEALEVTEKTPTRIVRMNPKAVTAEELFGCTDPLSGEWTKGVFASIWEKYNNRSLPFNTWIMCDGPVDTLWIESLNTVLDDNRILTLANGDRILMTDNVKIMFENENLNNASPATVSRAGIIYVSEQDLDWWPVAQAWVNTHLASMPHLQDPVRQLFVKHIGENTHEEPGHLFDFLTRHTKQAMHASRSGMVTACFNLLGVLLARMQGALAAPGSADFDTQVERIFLYSLIWTVGGTLEPHDREKLDAELRKRAPDAMPDCNEEETVFEYGLDEGAIRWRRWTPEKWEYPDTEELDFSNLLVPTMDSTRAIYLLDALHGINVPVLMVGGPGTAKTSSALMFFRGFDPEQRLLKRINFSSATTPHMFQTSIEADLDKRGGKSFGPPNGKKMTVFLDDLSMPEINEWGDQPTNEIVRQLLSQGGFYFLDKDKRGDFKVCEDLDYVAAMNHPGGGRNDIPSRLKRQFFIFNMVLPSITSINDIYGQMLSGRFTSDDFDESALEVVSKLTQATIQLWRDTKQKMLPTPAKFHYIFNMRELSRVFQGILLTPLDTLKTGGCKAPTNDVPATLLRLWKHECFRVFQDKLTNYGDKDWFANQVEVVMEDVFGEDLADTVRDETFFVDFFRDDVYDEETEEFLYDAPKVYEPAPTLQEVRDRVAMFMAKHNSEFPSRSLELVLFEDAMRHLIRIARILSMPRASALLVGVGGSGKQSLTRLSAYIARSHLFQIALTKSYNVNALMDDLRELYELSGHQRKSVTFLFTDAEIKDENFLEYINSVLLTGEVPGLFAKDEMMAMCADLQPHFRKERPGQVDTPDNLKQFFIDNVRDNLHVILCMSPVNPKFPERARKFPGLISGTTIDWFLPWPEEALVAVAKGFLGEYHLEAEDEVKEELIQHMGKVHKLAVEVGQEYYAKMRRQVYQTPKSFLSFLANYREVYARKLEWIKQKESRVNLGLNKLIQGGEDVAKMRVVLEKEKVKLAKATEETNAMLGSLEVSSAEAQKESNKVMKIKSECESEAKRIEGEKEECEADLAKAKPFLLEAEEAIASIKPADINEVKKLPKPSDIIKLVFDGVLILFSAKLDPVTASDVTVNKKNFAFITPSFGYAQGMMADTKFLTKLMDFERDNINEETIELLLPYIDLEDFNPQVAKSASRAVMGLCTWVRAMKYYHEASKIVKPKLEKLAVAEAKLDAAQKALAEAQARLDACNARLQELQDAYEKQMGEKQRLEDNANQLQRKLDQAAQLIDGLKDERERWKADSNEFADIKRRLIGDCAVACAFVSYCGPFNQVFRRYMMFDKFAKDCRKRGVPVTAELDVIEFLVDVGTIGDWNLQGLPTDTLSIQNGILVTNSSRYPLLVDPQGQALHWIRNKEAENMPIFGIINLNNPSLKENLEFCMQEGKALVVVGVEEELDPLLDPVLEKRYVQRGKNKYVNVADTLMLLHSDFRMYFITRLPNPHFSPELQAKTTVVDFTVTMKGLEEQLLGRVIAKEQKALEDLLKQVLAEVNDNTKALMRLDDELLQRLTENEGNLLDDVELVSVLANTKAKAAEVQEKLNAARETRRNINEKREQFRPVATRGSVLYFSIVEMSMVNVMYQTSLAQFIELFMSSMDKAEKASLASKRVQKIIDAMTYIVYRYINRGLYEQDKLTFVFIVTVKILVTAGLLDQGEVSLFLRGGAALDPNAVKKKKPAWMTQEAWLNVIQLSDQCAFYKALPENIIRNESTWRGWYESNEPDALEIPDFDSSLRDNGETGPWLRLLLLRMMRVDRTRLVVRQFIRGTEQMGPRYVEPVTDTMESIYDTMTPDVPVIFLLSTGADPTEAIEQLKKRKKQSMVVVSMGDGQEKVAQEAINAGAAAGTWVLLQNCELGLDLMDKMEDMIGEMRESLNPDFRLFITALPHPKFPLGLLQMSTKVTNEPPQGLQAGLLRSYSTIVDQDRLERIDVPSWRQLVFAICFLHSIVQERRKFGPLGWNIPYEFNNGDLTASITFLEKHMYGGSISWPTVQYMVSEVQYGGKITDDMDRRLFNTYALKWVSPAVLAGEFSFNPKEAINRIPGDFKYVVCDATEIEACRRYAQSLPEIDSPEVFGLHPNADLTFRIKEVNAMLETLSETQPKQSGGGSGQSLEDVVMAEAERLLGMVPEEYVEDEYRAKIKALGGLDVPLNIFLFQEIQRLQAVIGKVRGMLKDIMQAIRGEIVMTTELVQAMNDIFDAKVPRSWIFTPGGDEFSWILPTLGLWFPSLIRRDMQFRSWLNNDRPPCFWMTGFFNPQGFLTAMKQEVTRKHKQENWSLDDVTYYTEVTEHERMENVRSGPREGVYVYGLTLDGAQWSSDEGTLKESEPKVLFADLPVLYVTAMTKGMLAARKEMFGAMGPYECPCYKYPSRTDKYLIFMVNLVTKYQRPSHWILRGVALLCSKDQGTPGLFSPAVYTHPIV